MTVITLPLKDYRIRLALAVCIGSILGIFTMFGMSFLYTEEAIHDSTIKEFKHEVLVIEDAWEVNVYPDAKFDAKKYDKPVELTPVEETK
jgi:hypothetical protein